MATLIEKQRGKWWESRCKRFCVTDAGRDARTSKPLYTVIDRKHPGYPDDAPTVFVGSIREAETKIAQMERAR